MAQNNDAKIGVGTATIIGMNAMIGAGVFIAPAAIGSYVGPAGIVAYLFVVVAVWCIAQSLARVAARFPEEGSFYTYTKQWGGHALGLFAGGIYIVGLLIAMGLLSQAAGGYLHNPFFPNVSAQTLGLITLCSLVILNMFGVVLSEIGQQILICTTTFPLIATTILCFSKAQLSNLFPFAPYGLHNILKATKAVVFGFFGFECASSLFAIVKDPAKNVPRALTYSIAIVGTLYITFVTSIILSTPLNAFSDPREPVSMILHTVFPQNAWIITLIHISILSAVLGTTHSMIWSSSALLVSLFKQVGSINLNPRLSVLLVGICIFMSFYFLQDVDLFLSLTAACIIIAYSLSIMTLLFIKEEWNSKQNYITIGGLLTASLILYFAFEGIYSNIIA